MTVNKIMHKRQLVDEVARRSGPWGLTRRHACDALPGILDVITDKRAEGNAVTIAGLCRLEAKEYKGQRVAPRSPRRGDEPNMTKRCEDGIMPPA